MAASSITESRSSVEYSKGAKSKKVEVVTLDFTADSTDGTFTVYPIVLNGYLVKVLTNPGSTAPTDNWDIALQDPNDSALDAAASLLINRDTANTEQVYPVVSGATTPIFLAGSYGLAITGNSVNSATGRIVLYLVDEV